MTELSKKYIKPAFKRNAVAISTLSSSEYVPFLSVYLESIKHTASKHKNYDVVIIHNNIPQIKQMILKKWFETSKNLSLRFYNPTELAANYITKIHFTYTTASYNRLLIGEIFKKYPRIIITDADLIFVKDPAELYSMDINGFPLASIIEPLWRLNIKKNVVINNMSAIEYSKNILNLEDVYNYYNTGVMLVDIRKWNKLELTNQLIHELCSKTHYVWKDQCIINKVLYGKIYTLPWSWNREASLAEEVLQELLAEMSYEDDIKQWGVIHYLGNAKPWSKVGGELDISVFWWMLARNSPFYELLLSYKYKN